MKSNKNIQSRIVKNSLILVAMFAVAQYVFAVSGIRLSSGEKDKNKKTHHSSGIFSDLKSTITFSIKDNYTFNKKNWITYYKSSSSEQAALPNSIISYKKGNTVYILPYKQQSGLKLPDFIRMMPSEPLSR
ncbi:hypothetical protein [Agriterribacter sp.]|uniref:hypothetical protein n=1 Tax=Agriterribacter sp. TaxID=2821509 RepID=UPI002BF60385|nr:hypothetical protein [Agriterribacter sp.]HRP55987.1 hypothetical protein [Agriterribacter sp.]